MSTKPYLTIQLIQIIQYYNVQIIHYYYNNNIIKNIIITILEKQVVLNSKMLRLGPSSHMVKYRKNDLIFF